MGSNPTSTAEPTNEHAEARSPRGAGFVVFRTALTGGTAAKRAGAYAVAGQIPVLGLLDVLWHLWDRPHRQCLHDKFAGTVVVKITPGQGAAPGPWDGR